MKRLALLFLSLTLTLPAVAQEGITICHTPAMESFAMLASNKNFNADHREPLPYVHQSAVGKMITFSTPDGKEGTGYYLEPNVDSDEYLFVFHEWWGLNDYIKKEAEKYFDDLQNVHVIALDMYDGKVASTREEAGKLMQGMDQARGTAIVKGALDWAGINAEIATVGWCFGGGWALEAGLITSQPDAGPELVGAVMYYGMPVKDVKRLKMLEGPVLGIFGSQDEWINPDVVDAFRANMAEAGVPLDVKMYDAVHAFANPSNPDYNKEYAEEAYRISLAFLQRQLN